MKGFNVCWLFNLLLLKALIGTAATQTEKAWFVCLCCFGDLRIRMICYSWKEWERQSTYARTKMFVVPCLTDTKFWYLKIFRLLRWRCAANTDSKPLFVLSYCLANRRRQQDVIVWIMLGESVTVSHVLFSAMFEMTCRLMVD